MRTHRLVWHHLGMLDLLHLAGTLTCSVPLVGEWCGLCDLVFSGLQQLVTTGPRHMLQHVLVAIGEALREFWLLGRALDLGPLTAGNSFRHVVRAGSRTANLRNNPRLGALGRRGLAKSHTENLWLRQLEVCVVIPGWGYLLSQPLCMLSEMHSCALATHRKQ